MEESLRINPVSVCPLGEARGQRVCSHALLGVQRHQRSRDL